MAPSLSIRDTETTQHVAKAPHSRAFRAEPERNEKTETCWLRRQSHPNPSQVLNSLLSRKITGKLLVSSLPQLPGIQL
jgi:hypothetical protein